MGGKKLLGLVLIGAALLATPAAAMAGKGGGNKPTAVSSSIALNQAEAARTVGLLSFGQEVTFTTVIGSIAGGEWPMVYVECISVNDGSVLYGQLDHPDVAFLLGGGSSPWWSVQSDAECRGKLLAYGGRSKGVDTIRLLAESERFYVVGWQAEA